MHDDAVNPVGESEKAPQIQSAELTSEGLPVVTPSAEGPVIQVDAGSSGGHSLGADFRYKKVPVTFQGPRPFPHYLAVRIACGQYVHSQIYVKLVTAAPLKKEYRLHRSRGAELGSAEHVAAAVCGSTFEYTEGAPGLQPGDYWVLVIFSDEPIALSEVIIEDRNPREDVAARSMP